MNLGECKLVFPDGSEWIGMDYVANGALEEERMYETYIFTGIGFLQEDKLITIVDTESLLE